MNNSPTPQSSRRFMDFAPSRRTPKSPQPPRRTPVTQPSRPTQSARPVSRPTPMSRPIARPVQASRPAPRLATPRPQTHLVHEHIEATTVYYPSAKPAAKPKLVAEDDFLDIETSGLGIIEDLGTSERSTRHLSTPDAPDNSNYTLGGQSPFINTDKVDKRPLSSHLPKNKPAKKNVYDKVDKSTDKKFLKKGKKDRKIAKSTPTVVTGTASRGNSISLAIAIILTVILGAIVGTVAYLAFFQ